MAGSNTNDQLPDIQESNAQILTDIQSLQNIEQDLFNSLEQNANLTTQQQEEIIKKINDISKMRINLYKTLNNVNNFFQSALSNSKGTLTEQTSAVDIVEQELNSAKQRLKVLEEEKNNKVRLVEINDYYGQKYAEHSDFMKIIIIMLVPILILAILFNKGIIPSTAYYILIGIISVIGSVFLIKRFLSIISRDAMNYQEYQWYFNPETAPTTTLAEELEDPWASSKASGLTCIGDACCSEGLVYDTTLNQCTNSISSNSNTNSNTNVNLNSPDVVTDTTTETFMNNIFTKSAYSYKKPDVFLGQENIFSNSSSSFINFPKF
jgi:hypothetical protein